MPFYRSAGHVPPKRHTQHRTADGALLFEELTGSDGFSADSSLLYHRNQPAQVLDVRPWALPDQTLQPNDPFLPRHVATHRLFAEGAAVPSPLYRNAIGDECLFVEAGAATVETAFGDLAVDHGDYVTPAASITPSCPPAPCSCAST